MGCLNEGIKSYYAGETGDMGYNRFIEHLCNLSTMNHENSALAKHCTVQHNGQLQEFKIRIQGVYRTCLERQSAEAVVIEQLRKKADILINNRSETQLEKMNRNRERIEKKDQEKEKEEVCDRVFDQEEERNEGKKHIEEMIRKRKEKGRGRPRKRE